MLFKQWLAGAFIVCLGSAGLANAINGTGASSALDPQTPAPTQFVTAEELKAKLAKSEPVTVIDVRASSDLDNSENKIKGAIHVKLRKLQSRLGMPPLKDIPRNSEVVTYCACPNDEASIRAAQLLTDAGFKRVRALRGGWVACNKTHGQVEGRPKGL
jgi:rhodanese-related sulfurtransferase